MITWIDVKKELPPLLEDVLVCRKGGFYEVAELQLIDDRNVWRAPFHRFSLGEVAYWAHINAPGVNAGIDELRDLTGAPPDSETKAIMKTYNDMADRLGEFTDPRDYIVYKTVKIGNQVWMAENMNYSIDTSIKAENPNSGQLYTWGDAVKVVPPPGWHLPTDAEWKELIDFVYPDKSKIDDSALKLRSTSGWCNNVYGEDGYGFNAIPTDFDRRYSKWWSATERVASYAWYRLMGYGSEYVGRNWLNKTYLFSVRCVQD